ncbi:MAG TPA: twin-arginine translocation signal domain-containing protein [Pseudolabrys sp.]|nr:twin-arginine translocation signal domain-containing protein [Pseudolabrys sp.]
MKQQSKLKVGRRDFLRVLGVGAGAAVTPAVLVAEARADSENTDEKRKARYKGDSEDVKAFYRVNHYPK